MSTLDVGSVLFRHEGDSPLATIMGDERVALLRAFYRGEPLPKGIVVYAFGYPDITTEDVNWDTAGARVTGNVGTSTDLPTS